MAFRFRCPKCNTTSFSIERDSRSYAPRGQTHELIFSCRCGKQLFGDQIEKEYNRQKTEWEATAAERRKERAAKKATRPAAATDDAYEQQRAARVERSAAEEREQESRRKEEDKKWRERVAKKSDDKEEAPAAEADGVTCEWKDCDNPPRPNSKYCSRDCSNKNARHRYKRRKGRGREAA